MITHGKRVKHESYGARQENVAPLLCFFHACLLLIALPIPFAELNAQLLPLSRGWLLTVGPCSKLRNRVSEKKNCQYGGYQTVNAECADESEIEVKEVY